ncbi:acetoin utilization protein AcuC [Marinitenerispora sediminis]|uniref:Acetoin utilization protein AcuC n=1 Tax=Marinitenerispora sediminis TaxID=1931232 RepID=A0A368T0X0_9ACTN|nr:acetoin utilization protein AcuC [Marinitenerispora sediminis]RCV49979.1 acetoin utilization protein AcuC [Marinitenerispora sediminis]RCV50211.1 acetoin utilization protein AcuC [Marinitenerispora sediminis]RCV53425.1 acetoin utilization protein AcuC [Marinitenerispora sediminis]
MGCSLRVAWDEELTSYNFGPQHPLAPVRVELTMALSRELGVFDAPNVAFTGVEPASDDLLRLVHDPGYIEAVKRAGTSLEPDDSYSLGTSDNPVFPRMHEAAALISGASVAAARAVWNGESEHAVNIAGGLHHAMPGHAWGFCVYNDAALAIAWLLEQGAKRVAYVDVDVHHGDGVQTMFYDDPRVLTISLHESPLTLFPGTGRADEVGGPHAEGYAVNVALPAGTNDPMWLRAFHAVVPPLLREFQPEVLVTQHGCDTHALDPLANLTMSVDGQRSAYQALHQLAKETAAGRWVVLGGGGYELVQVVPRAWTHLLSEVAGTPLDPELDTPAAWRNLVRERTGDLAPLRMTDGRRPEYTPFEDGFDPDDPVDRAIQATRTAVFPCHGIDPNL